MVHTGTSFLSLPGLTTPMSASRREILGTPIRLCC